MPEYDIGSFPERLMSASRGLANSPQDCSPRHCGAVALFESSHGQHKQKVPSRGTAGDLLLMGHEGLEPPTKRL